MIKVIKFYSTGCGPCKMLAPILNKLKDEYKFELKEVCVDDGVPKEYETLNITSVPTLLIYKDNTLVEKIVGLTQESKLKEIIGGL